MVPDNPQGKAYSLKIASLLLASMLTMMAGAIVAPALPEITIHFAHIQGVELLARLLITLPALAIFLTSFGMGALADRYGRIPVLNASLVLYFIAGTAGLYLNNLYLILATRFVLGIAVSGVMTAVLTLIGDYYHGEERNRVMGIQGAFMGIGGVVFISLSGFLADVSWHAPFLLYAFSAPVFLLGLLCLNEPDRSAANATSNTGRSPAKVHFPMVLLILFSGFTGIVFFFMMPVQLPYLLKEIPGLPNWKIGIGIAASTMSAAIVAMNLRRIRSVISNPQMYAVAFFFMAIGYFLVSLSHSYGQFIGALLVAGLGTGLLMPAPMLWIVAVAPLRFRGRLVGLISAFTFLGQFASPLIFQPMIMKTSVRAAFAHASFILIGLAVVYLLFSLYYNKKLASKVEIS
jgi:MFS family permease